MTRRFFVFRSSVQRLLKALGFSVVVLAIAAAGTWLILAASEDRWPWSAQTLPPADEFQPDRFLMPQEAFEQFPIVPVAEVKNALDPAELVLGVTIGDESRVYPLNVLNEVPQRKVVNDTLGGQAIAATWCDACHSGIVYAREVEGRTLTLAVAGQLWKDSMVLYDQETGTHWAQLSGEAKRGPLKGKRLRQIPSVVTDWESWRRLIPKASVLLLPPGRREFRRDFYHRPENFVLGIADGDAAKSWGLQMLRQSPVCNDQWDDRPVLVAFDAASSTAALYERTLPAGVLTFRSVGDKIVDEQGGSTWNPVTGEAESGPLCGRRLRRLPAVLATRKAWEAFHP